MNERAAGQPSFDEYAAQTSGLEGSLAHEDAQTPFRDFEPEAHAGRAAVMAATDVPAAETKPHQPCQQPETDTVPRGRLMPWRDIIDLGRSTGFSATAISRLRSRLQANNTRHGSPEHIKHLAQKLWHDDPATSDETIDTLIDVYAARDLLRALQVYAQYSTNSVVVGFRDLGPISLSLLAHYVNQQLGLEGDDKLPVYKLPQVQQ